MSNQKKKNDNIFEVQEMFKKTKRKKKDGKNCAHEREQDEALKQTESE